MGVVIDDVLSVVFGDEKELSTERPKAQGLR
jgi:hypothetical protein